MIEYTVLVEVVQHARAFVEAASPEAAVALVRANGHDVQWEDAQNWRMQRAEPLRVVAWADPSEGL